MVNEQGGVVNEQWGVVNEQWGVVNEQWGVVNEQGGAAKRSQIENYEGRRNLRVWGAVVVGQLLL